MAKFSDLSLRAQRELMEEYRNKGINDLSDMIADYEKEVPSDTTSSGTSVSVPFSLAETYRNGGKIHIKPSKRGTFTAAATKHGKSVQEFASQVLAHPENYSPAMRRKANFARNAARWHAEGGHIYDGYNEPINQLWQVQYPEAPEEYNGGTLPAAVMTAPLPAKFNGSQAAARRYAEGYKWATENVTKPTNRIAHDYVAPALAATFAAPVAIDAAAAVVANPWLRLAADTVGNIDGIRNAASKNGVAKTIRLAKEGDTVGAIKSGIGDVLDIAGTSDLIRTASKFRGPNLRLHAFNSVEPFDYSNSHRKIGRLIKDVIEDTPVNLSSAPDWRLYGEGKTYANKLKYEYGLPEYRVNSIMDTREDAWRIYNGLPQRNNSYILNSDGTYSYNLDNVRKSIPSWRGMNVDLNTRHDDFLETHGGLWKDEFIPLGSDSDYGVRHIEDLWDLHPFSRTPVSKKAATLLKNTVGDLPVRNAAQRFRTAMYNKGYWSSYSDKANGLIGKATKWLDNPLNRFRSYTPNAKEVNGVWSNGRLDRFLDKAASFLEPFDEPLRKFEIGKFTGGKPFMMKTDIPVRRLDNTLGVFYGGNVDKVLADGGHIFAFGTPDETVLPEEFAYTPEIQDEIVATPKINLSKGWRFNRGYYNDMVQNIIAGNDPLINRENYSDIYFSGKRRAGRKLKKAIAKADAKQTKLDNEAWQEQQQKQYRDYIINGLRNNTLTPEEFGNYTSYGIDRYGVPIAAPIVGAAVAGAAAPAFSALRGVGKFVPKAMDYTFNPVGAALRTGVEGATKLGASTVAGMSVPTASMVATGTDIGMMSVYGAKAAQEMRERGITPENATSFGMSVIPAFGVPIAAGYKYVKPLIDGMPSLRSAFTSSAKVGGNGITPWRSYMARQVLNPDSLYSKVTPEKFLKRNAAKKQTLANRANAASDAAAMTSNAQYDLITNMSKAPTDARGMWLHTKREMPAQLLNNDMMYTFPVKPLGDPVAVSEGTVMTPLTYTTSQGNTVSVQVPVHQGAFTEAHSTSGISFMPRGYDYASGTFPLTSRYKVKAAVTGSPSSLVMNSSASEPLVEAVKKDFDMLQNAAGDSGLVIGSGVVAKRYGVTSPGDADFVATRKTGDELKRKLGFEFDKLNAAGGDKGTMKYSINGKNIIDIDYIEGNDTESWGTLAEQFYQYLHPEEYVRLRNQRAFSQLGGKSTTDFHLPISPEALLAEVKNDPNALLFRTLMDNIGSGKVKHINRIKSLIDFAPEQLSEVTRIYSRGLFGREVPVTETYPNMRFDDVAANEDFLQALGLPKSWAKSPEKVKAATSLLDFSLNTVTSGKGRRGDVKTISDLERFIDSGTSATNAAGPGANTVTAANHGGGASYAASGANTVHRVNATYNPEEIETPAQLLRKMQTQVATGTDVFIGYSPDKLKKAHDILQKYGIADDLESVTTQEQLYFELNDAQDSLNASLGYEKASEVLKEVTKALDIPAVRSATEFIDTDSFITEAGGYVGSFSAGRSPEGELIYGANVPGGKLETPKLFTNKDLLPQTTAASPKLQMRSVIVDDPTKAAEAYKAVYPNASAKEISDFEAVVVDTENYIKTYLEEAKKAAEELEAAGFPEKYGLKGGYDKLSPMAKQIMDISMVDDHFSPKVLAEAFKDMDKIKDLQKRVEDISQRRDFLWKLVHERAALTVPYNHNKAERNNIVSYSILATLAGMLGYGTTAGIRSASDRSYYKDSDYNKFVSDSFPEFPSGKEIPWSEYTADNRKDFEEKYKDELKAYNKAHNDVIKQRRDMTRKAKKDYASINRALREYEKNKKRR